MPVQAKTQEEAAVKAKEAFNAQPKASAKTGRSFFERLKPEKVSCPALWLFFQLQKRTAVHEGVLSVQHILSHPKPALLALLE